MHDPDNPGFEDMKLKVGERLQVSLRRNPKTVYYPTLIGYVAGEYLLLKIPFDHGLSVPMLEGEAVTVRVFSGVSVFSFDCMVESFQLSPHYHMYLSFPEAIQAIPLRDAPRVRTSLPVQIKTADHPEWITAELSDLSISGALITADSQLGKTGDVIVISFAFRVQPTNQEVRIASKATIRSCQQLHGNAPDQRRGAISFSHGIGIHFEDIAPNDLVMVQHYLYEHMD